MKRGEPIRAAVISDTHGLLRPEVEQILETCDVIIHAGDFDNQMLYHKLHIRQPLYAVRGNNDGFWGMQLPLVRRFELGGVRFVMAHERSDLPQLLGEEQVVIFGHSHMYYQKIEDGRLWLNPGSCGYKRFTLPLSLAVMTLQDGNYDVKTIWLDEEYGRESGAGLRRPEDGAVGESARKPVTGRAGAVSRRFAESAGRAFAGTAGRAFAEPAAHAVEESDSQADAAAAAGESRQKEAARRKEEQKQQERDQLFLIAKIMRFMKRGETINWVADNLKSEPAFVETIYRICVTHPGADAHQILDKLEVNRIFSAE